MIVDHLCFNEKYFLEGAEHARRHALKYGLEFEVLSTYGSLIKRAFNTNDYPLDENAYLQLADEALMEWDI